jgi:hypothetical protein
MLVETTIRSISIIADIVSLIWIGLSVVQAVRASRRRVEAEPVQETEREDA